MYSKFSISDLSLNQQLLRVASSELNVIDFPSLDKFRHEYALSLEAESDVVALLQNKLNGFSRIYMKLVLSQCWKVRCNVNVSETYFGFLQSITYKEYLLRKILPSWNETYFGKGSQTGADHYAAENEKYFLMFYLYHDPLKINYHAEHWLSPFHTSLRKVFIARLPAKKQPMRALRARDLFSQAGVFG